MVDGRGQRTTPARNNRTVDSASDDDEHAPDSQQAHDANVKNGEFAGLFSELAKMDPYVPNSTSKPPIVWSLQCSRNLLL